MFGGNSCCLPLCIELVAVIFARNGNSATERISPEERRTAWPVDCEGSFADDLDVSFVQSLPPL